jgi:hypothetical protein
LLSGTNHDEVRAEALCLGNDRGSGFPRDDASLDDETGLGKVPRDPLVCCSDQASSVARLSADLA